MFIKLLIIGILSVLSAVAYRMGGSGRYNRLWRIIGVPLLSIMALLALFGLNLGIWWIYALCFGLSCGFISTYWDFLTGGKYDNFFIHGFMLGIAFLPYVIYSGHFIGFGLRCIVLALFMGIWCNIHTSDIWEECGRGASIIVTMPLLLI